MRTLLTLLTLCFALEANAATYLLLSQTNAFAQGIVGQARIVGTVSNNVAVSGLLAVDATKTNGVAATPAMLTNTAGIFDGDSAKYVGGDFALHSAPTLASLGAVAKAGDTMTGLLQLNLGLSLTNDVFLVRDAANTLAMRNGGTAGATVPQTLRVYNWWSSASDSEWGTVGWNETANTFTVGTKKTGTGAARSLQFMYGNVNSFYLDAATGNLIWNTHDTAKIGSSTSAGAPNQINAGGSINAGVLLSSGGNIQAAGTADMIWFGRCKINSPADGVFAVLNNAKTAYAQVNLSGVQGGNIKVLTSTTLASLFWIAVPNTNAVGGEVVWTVTATDGTDTQQQTGRTQFGAVGKATAVTAQVDPPRTNTAAVSAGTLTVGMSANVSTNNVFALQTTATTSLTTTNLVIKWRLETPTIYTVNVL